MLSAGDEKDSGMETSVQPMLLGVKDAARMLGISPFTVRSWVYKGLLQFKRLGSRVLIPYAEVKRIAEEGLRASS